MEKWLPVQGYEGKYEVSNLGAVRSIARRAPSYGLNQIDRAVPARTLKPGVGARGYAFVTLCDAEKAQKQISLARLVATHFHGAPFDGAQVNHIDGNKLNDRADNLEWTTAVENIRHARDVLGAYLGSRNGRFKHGRRCINSGKGIQ